jgi:methionyl-tRNA formyltransferase
MMSQHPLAIAPDDTAATLHDKLAALGAAAIVDLLPKLAGCRAIAQDDSQATYAAKISKDEAALDWTQPAAVLARRIRAFDPFPGAVARFQGEPLKIWRARPVPAQGTPGEILSELPLVVACGGGALELMEVQKAGGKRMAAAAFVAGNDMAAGQRMA